MPFTKLAEIKNKNKQQPTVEVTSTDRLLVEGLEWIEGSRIQSHKNVLISQWSLKPVVLNASWLTVVKQTDRQLTKSDVSHHICISSLENGPNKRNFQVEWSTGSKGRLLLGSRPDTPLTVPQSCMPTLLPMSSPGDCLQGLIFWVYGPLISVSTGLQSPLRPSHSGTKCHTEWHLRLASDLPGQCPSSVSLTLSAFKVNGWVALSCYGDVVFLMFVSTRKVFHF